MVMSAPDERSIAAGEFKAQCLHILDEVQQTGQPVTVTKRGRPVARVVPVPSEPKGLFGIAKGTIAYARDDDLFSTDEGWQAER